MEARLSNDPNAMLTSGSETSANEKRTFSKSNRCKPKSVGSSNYCIRRSLLSRTDRMHSNVYCTATESRFIHRKFINLFTELVECLKLELMVMVVHGIVEAMIGAIAAGEL
jgi:hypothetical protein